MKIEKKTQKPNLDDVSLIPLTKNQFALVDADIYEYLDQWNWHVSVGSKHISYYAKRNSGSSNGPTTISMASEVIGTRDGFTIHHKNHQSLDNRRCNLEHVAPTENLQLKTPHQKEAFASKYIGVSCPHFKTNGQISTWRAFIKSKHIGSFATEEDAAKAYDKAASEEWGRKAQLNFPQKRK